jgi:hypothetical protein
VNASCAPPSASRFAIAQAIERLVRDAQNQPALALERTIGRRA